MWTNLCWPDTVSFKNTNCRIYSVCKNEKKVVNFSKTKQYFYTQNGMHTRKYLKGGGHQLPLIEVSRFLHILYLYNMI